MNKYPQLVNTARGTIMEGKYTGHHLRCLRYAVYSCDEAVECQEVFLVIQIEGGPTKYLYLPLIALAEVYQLLVEEFLIPATEEL